MLEWKRRHKWWRLVPIAATVLLLIGCSGDDDEDSGGPPPGMMNGDDDVTVTVETVEVQRGPFSVTGDYAGEIRSEQMTELSAEVSGRLETLAVDVGDTVSAGDLLAEIDDTSLRQNVRQLQANAAVARASREEANVNLENMQSELDRKKPLVDRDIVSEREIEQLENSVRSAEQQMAVADAQIEETEARLATAREDLRNTELRAPFDGKIGMRYVDRGTFVGPEQPLFQLVDDSELYLTVQVPERHAANVDMETPATIRIGALGQMEVEGQIRRIAPVVDSSTRSLRVDVEIQQQEDVVLRPGMFARVRLRLGHSDDALTINNQALLNDTDGTPYVWKADDGEARRVEFSSLGLQSRERTQIVDELQEGDRIVLRGHERLEEGYKLRDLEGGDIELDETAPAPGGQP